MAQDLDFSLPEEAKGRSRAGAARGRSLSVAIVLLLILNVALTLGYRRGPTLGAARAGSELGPEPTKELAMRLQKQGLHLRAAEVWN